jgi:hypothetical protein
VEEPSQSFARRLLKWVPTRAKTPWVNWGYAAAVAAAFVVGSATFAVVGPVHTQPLRSVLMPATLAAAIAPPQAVVAQATPKAQAPNAPAPEVAAVQASAAEPATNEPATLSSEPVQEQSLAAGTVGGSLELVDEDKISGWAWDSRNPSIRVAVAVYVDDVYAGWAKADKRREDLVKAGIGDGRHAYLIRSPDILKDGNSHSVSIRVAGVDRDLWGSPKSAP